MRVPTPCGGLRNGDKPLRMRGSYNAPPSYLTEDSESIERMKVDSRKLEL
jgi:hypothetical protein